LRRYFGLGLDIWIQPVSGVYAEALANRDYSPDWSVASLAKKGDLVLFYRTRPDSLISDIFKVAGDVSAGKADWSENRKRRKDYGAPIRRVATLASPIHFEDLVQHPVLRHAPFVRAHMQGRPNVTEYWPYIYDMIVRRNRDSREPLQPYKPK
jgi:hypothetical protein